jgi:hypothetical protein
MTPQSHWRARQCIFLKKAYAHPETRKHGGLTVIVQILMEARPVEVAGKWFIDVTMNGRPMKKRGPYASVQAAKAAADEFIRHWSSPAANPPADDAVVLNGVVTKIDSTEGRKFVVDACRAGEGLIDDKTLQEIYKISPPDWKNIAENKALAAAIRDEGRRRVRSGQRAKEAAQGIFVKAPTVLDSIMSDERASPRHRIEAAREIRQVAIGSEDESTAEATERFTITINLGADVEPFKLDVDPKDIRHNTKQIESEIDVD